MADWGKIAQAGGTAGRAFMKDRTRRRTEKIQDYNFEQQQAGDRAVADEQARMERLQPLISQYMQAAQSGDAELMDQAYNAIMTSPDAKPEQMAKFSELHQTTKQKVYDRNKGVSDNRYRATTNARGRGARITDFDEYGNPKGFENIPENELPPETQAELQYKRSLAKRYATGGRGQQGASASQSPPQSAPGQNKNRIATRKDALKEYNALKKASDPSVDDVSAEEYVDKYERIVSGKAEKPTNAVQFKPYDSAVQSGSGRIAGAQADGGVKPNASLTPEEDQKLRAAAKAFAAGDKVLEEEKYNELVKAFLAHKGQ